MPCVATSQLRYYSGYTHWRTPANPRYILLWNMSSQSCRPVCHVPFLFQLICGVNKLFESFFSIELCWSFFSPFFFFMLNFFVLVVFSITELLYPLLVRWTEFRRHLVVLGTNCLKFKKNWFHLAAFLDATVFSLQGKSAFVYCLFIF